jgi:hypothetical protein
MRTFWLKEIFVAAAMAGLMAGATMAAAQSATNNNKAVDQTSASVKPLLSTNAATALAAPASQSYAPIGGAFTPALMGRTGFNPTNPVALGGMLGVAPLGGNWQPGPVGGTWNGGSPVGGRLDNVLVGGNFPAAAPAGGALSGRPAGGQLGTNVLGGIRSSNFSFTGGSNGVIVGGAQQGGVSPGGVLVGSHPARDVMTTGNSPGGVIVGGAPAMTNAPGGNLR